MCCSGDSNPKAEVLAGLPPSEAPEHQDKRCHTPACLLTAGSSPPLVQLLERAGRWLCGSEHWLLLQRVQVWFQ